MRIALVAAAVLAAGQLGRAHEGHVHDHSHAHESRARRVGEHATRARGCGAGHPALNVEPQRVPQTYKSAAAAVAASGRARGLDQVYDESDGAFLSLAAADAAGLAANMRITLVWDTVDAGDTATGEDRQCTAVAMPIIVPDASFVDTAWDGCSKEDIVIQGNARYNTLRARLEFARDRWESILKIKPVQDSIVVDASIVSSYGLATNTYSNTDLVVIAVARPSPFASLAGYASCLQTDQFGRCTVGYVNIVPATLNPAQGSEPSVVDDELHTAIHEMNHILGGIRPGAGFIDEAGNPQPENYIFTIEEAFDEDARDGVSKPVTLIRTPRVVNLAREHFDCPTLPGMPLEDVRTGRGSHWEARLMGAELMSYGAGSGEAYISDLTLAFLEDTNQYIANYSLAGRFTEPTTNDFKTRNAFGFLRDSSSDDYTPPAPRSVGALRWGRSEGCAFVRGNPRNWPDRYRCTKNQEYGCTADNRMSSVCVIKTNLKVAPKYSCGRPFSQDPSCTSGPTNPSSCNGGECDLPPEMQYFTDDSAVAAFADTGAPIGVTPRAGNTGGFSASMDYVPVQIGYWSCLDSKAAENVTGRVNEESGGFDFNNLIGGAEDDMKLFGGQARCPECRCFVSSLMEIVEGVNPLFPRYGLCYRSNCYQPDYLQIAIKNQLGDTVNWYKCPSEGGKMYIAGFSGAFHCPPAEDFCRHETITGIKYPETNNTLELIFYGVVGGLLFISLVVCIFPACRDKLVQSCKGCCGVLSFEEIVVTDAVRDTEEFEERFPPAKPSVTLLFVSTFTMMLGNIIFSVSVYAASTGISVSAALPTAILGGFVSFTSAIGIIGSRKPAKGASCFILVFFFLAIASVLMLLWASIYALLSSDVMEQQVSRHWDIVKDLVPSEEYDASAPREQQVAQTAEFLQSHIEIVGGAGLFALAIYIIAIAAAGLIINRPVLISTTFTVLNYFGIVIGLGIAIIGAIFLSRSAAGYLSLGGAILGIGGFLFLTSIVGLWGIRKKDVPKITFSTGMSFVALLAFGVGCWLGFNNADETAARLDDLSDADMAALQSSLGTSSLSRSEMVLYIRDQMYQVALACLVGACVTLVHFVCGMAVKTATRQWLLSHPSWVATSTRRS